MKHNDPKNCAIGRSSFDSDSSSFGIVGYFRHWRFFPKQEEKVDSIEQIIDATTSCFC